MEMLIWFLVYVVLILAMARWRDHLDAVGSKKQRPTSRASASRVSRRRLPS